MTDEKINKTRDRNRVSNSVRKHSYMIASLGDKCIESSTEFGSIYLYVAMISKYNDEALTSVLIIGVEVMYCILHSLLSIRPFVVNHVGGWLIRKTNVVGGWISFSMSRLEHP